MAALMEGGSAGLERYRLRLERSRERRDLKPVVALLEWLKQPEHRELQRSFASWIRNVLLRARMPGVEIAEMADLLKVNTMLANRVVEWTQEWERRGVGKTLSKARAVLIHHIEARFGPLSEDARERLGETDSVETLMDITGRVPLARSLADLGLG